ncbi:unnamed protein product [Danaus chrysippus]|uniref:(African queen) hypothetical protein n=1 Tax=Danaus chrysippus TaxID=151541 RepID=A0A8J2QRZ0_9NEOP|nr:unnamed protein product [Danaus chrysippus]
MVYCQNLDLHTITQTQKLPLTHLDAMLLRPIQAAPEGTPGGLAPAEPQTGPDGEIIGGPRTPQQIAAQRRLQQTQAQVDEVVDIMKANVEKVLDRDAKLSELDDRADALQQGASQFEQQAKSLKNKFWLQNLKDTSCKLKPRVNEAQMRFCSARGFVAYVVLTAVCR